ncbi:MAG: hypothetical protein NXI31_04010 [bacterium]|nr:hypothetical protein [bacterium]
MATPRLLVLPLALAFAASGSAQSPTYAAATHAQADPALSGLAGGAMLALPGLFTDFVISGGGQFVELPNGNARLTGRVFSQSSLYSAFLVDIEFSGRVDPGQPSYPPAGAPNLQLLNSAYTPVGTIDPATFAFFTQASGTLTGVRNYDGAVLDLQLTTTPAQLGDGANNLNGNRGLVASFNIQVLQQPPSPLPPLSTASLTIDLPGHRTDKVTHPQVDAQRTNLAAGRALVLPGVADDYVFVPAGEFTEYDDGHAELAGRLARLADLTDAWHVALNFTNRVDPGEANHPPTGSPVLQMLPSAYVAGGGTMNPAHWHYYETVTGTLTGDGQNAGGLITLTNSTPFQYGGAANQTNTYYGYYGACSAAVTTQPAGRTIGLTGDAELFGLTATFPVLPFPTLTVPSTNPTLPTLTDQGVVVTGDNLAWAELVGIDFDLAGPGDEARWFHGYFRVLDNQTIEVHPRPGKPAGTYSLSVYNPAIRSNVIPLDLTTPSAPTLLGEPAVSAFETLHLHMHQGAGIPGAAISALAFSGSLLPTVFPGIANLGIGDNQTQLTVLPGSFLHDPATGIARFDLGPIPPWFTGFTWHFQAVTVDLVTPMLPLPTTNVFSVDF